MHRREILKSYAAPARKSFIDARNGCVSKKINANLRSSDLETKYSEGNHCEVGTESMV